MKFYKYWVRVERPLQIEGKPVLAKFVGKSNLSHEQAVQDANAKVLQVQKRLNGEKPDAREDYAEDIREEITHEIDPRNIVTRTRYGARILNTTTLVILDIDQHKKGFLEFFGFKKISEKEGIRECLEKKIAPRYPRLGLRVYETTKGIRVIVQGEYYDPSGPEAKALMSRTNTDRLYAMLCARQKCYRARLTPKPSRMKMKSFKYIWPLDEGTVEAAQQWVQSYEAEAVKFSTCRYLNTLGQPAATTALIDFHDQATGALQNRPLA